MREPVAYANGVLKDEAEIGSRLLSLDQTQKCLDVEDIQATAREVWVKQHTGVARVNDAGRP